MTAIGPGSVVVCVDASGISAGYFQLCEGARYVVRAIVPRGVYDDGTIGTNGLRLRGIYNPPADTPLEAAYSNHRFRPIDSRDTAIFTDILADIPERVEA